MWWYGSQQVPDYWHSMIQRSSLSILVLAATALAGVPALAQGPGGTLPPLDIENVTVIGKRMVVLPKARKGEVLDTSVYRLPDGDSLLFSERISNLGGPGGTLPGYREFELPLKIDAEASMGSYVSPRLALRAEYIRASYDLAALADFRSTDGHVDGAGAVSYAAGAHGSVLVGDDASPLGRFRMSVALDHMGDSYELYGAGSRRTERSRTATELGLAIRNELPSRTQYRIGLAVSSASVEDVVGDTSVEVTALAPAFHLELGRAVDSGLDVRLRFDFASTSLRYSVPAQTPSYLSATAEAEWRAGERTTLTGGVLVASGQNSDSGSAALVMPRLAVRHSLGADLGLYAWFAPELRAASFRGRMLLAPYADREIPLHPERVPVRMAAGVNANVAGGTLDARLFFESAENTPVVVAGADTGSHGWRHLDSRTIGAAASLELPLRDDINLEAEALVRSAVEDGSGEALPMTPALDLRARGTWRASDRLSAFVSAAFQSEQRVLSPGATGGEETIASRLLLGCGASYEVLDRLRVFAEITNLVGYSYELWRDYQAPGFEARGGIRVTF